MSKLQNVELYLLKLWQWKLEPNSSTKINDEYIPKIATRDEACRNEEENYKDNNNKRLSRKKDSAAPFSMKKLLKHTH